MAHLLRRNAALLKGASLLGAIVISVGSIPSVCVGGGGGGGTNIAMSLSASASIIGVSKVVVCLILCIKCWNE